MTDSLEKGCYIQIAVPFLLDISGMKKVHFTTLPIIHFNAS